MHIKEPRGGVSIRWSICFGKTPLCHTNIYALMRKFYLVLATMLSVSAFVLSGCSKDATKEPPKTMKVEDYDYLGKMHNDFMSNAMNNLTITVADKNKDDLLSEITAFNVEYAHKSYFRVLPENISYFYDFEQLLYNPAFNQYLLKKQTKNSDSSSSIEDYFSNETGELEDMPSLYTMADYLYSRGILQKKSYDLLNEIIRTLSNSIEGQLSDANFCRRIEKFVNDFDNRGYCNDDIDGEMIASILAISMASIEWWKNNPDAALAEDKIPAVVAADLGGAVTGVVIDGIRQGICIGVGAQEGWDWASTGWAALGGAVDGSLGISSKIIKYFKMLK